MVIPAIHVQKVRDCINGFLKIFHRNDDPPIKKDYAWG